MKKGKTETMDLFGAESVTSTLKRETMAAAAKDGCACPVCDQFVKVYKRSITSTMARQLIHAWRCHGVMVWFHTRDVVMNSSGAGDFSKLEIWELIEKQPLDRRDDHKKTSGLWRITQKGADFIQGKITLPGHAAVYNGKLLEFIGPEQGIHEALGNKFNYRELMGWVKLSVDGAGAIAGRGESAGV